MKCFTPITIFRPLNGNSVNKDYRSDVVPCGKCPACLRRRQAGWIFRLEQEQLVSTSAAFLTLTYNNENLPYSASGLPNLNKKHHTGFIKRLRKQIHTHFTDENTQAIKYYSCGEYGTNTNRPHYHSIIFNLPMDIIENPTLLDTTWQMGNTMLAVCNTNTITYTTKYINKTLYHKKEPTDDRENEFQLQSKGLGKSYLTDKTIKYYKNQKIPYLVKEDGKKGTMPRYYRDKLYTKQEKIAIQLKTLKYIEENPQFISEKHRYDYIHQEFETQKNKNNLERQQL